MVQRDGGIVSIEDKVLFEAGEVEGWRKPDLRINFFGVRLTLQYNGLDQITFAIDPGDDLTPSGLSAECPLRECLWCYGLSGSCRLPTGVEIVASRLIVREVELPNGCAFAD